MTKIYEGPNPNFTDGTLPALKLDEDLIRNTFDTLDSAQASLNKTKKSLTFNNSSYSGVDIKVVVHKYSSPTVTLKADVERAIAAYSSIKDTLRNVSTRSIPRIADAGVKLKRSEINSLTYNLAIAEFRDYAQQVGFTENSIQDTGFNQFIFTSLNNLISQAQSNSIGAQNNVNDTIQYLDGLINGWKQQANALGSRSAEFINTKVLAELQTVSISTFREKVPVRALGSVGVKGFCRGPRTVAGSMIFTVFDRNVLFELLDVSEFDANNNFKSAIKDQLPPMDMTIMFANEYGALSRMTVYGVEFVSEGQAMSIEDMLLEDVCQFVARDIDPMTPVLNDQGEPYNVSLHNYNHAMALGNRSAPVTDLRASDLRGSEWDESDSTQSGAVSRFKRRAYPFI